MTGGACARNPAGPPVASAGRAAVTLAAQAARPVSTAITRAVSRGRPQMAAALSSPLATLGNRMRQADGYSRSAGRVAVVSAAANYSARSA